MKSNDTLNIGDTFGCQTLLYPNIKFDYTSIIAETDLHLLSIT